jgi:hypothetical protein
LRVSGEAYVFCRNQPDLPPSGELDDGHVVFSVRAVTPNDVREIPPEVSADGLAWIVVFELAGDWFDAFTAGGSALARRCGGGVLVIPEVEHGDEFEIEARPDPGSWSLMQALEQAFGLAADLDEAEWRQEVGLD